MVMAILLPIEMCLQLPILFGSILIEPPGPLALKIRVHRPYATATTELFVAPRSVESQRIGVTPLIVSSGVSRGGPEGPRPALRDLKISKN